MKKKLLILFTILISLLAIITTNHNFKNFWKKFINSEKISKTKESDTPKNDKYNERNNKSHR